MARYGVTDTGFKKKPYSVVIDSSHNNAKRMFGSDLDLTPGSPVKILIDLFAIEIVGLWSQLEATYNSAFLNTATGYALDNLGQLVGAIRTPSTYATGEVTFFRTTALTSSNPRIVPKGTKIATSEIRPKEYITSNSVYFQPAITAEEHVVDDPIYSFDAVNVIHSIQALYDNNNTNYLNSATFSGRTVTFTEQIDAGTILYISYKPLSITAPVIALEPGADSNVAANTITVLDTPIDFVTYISNENGIDSGSDVESDSHFRNKIIGATQSIGKATTNALKYYIGNVTGVKNVIIEDPLRVNAVAEISGNGTLSFYIPYAPIYNISSIVGSINGLYTIDSFDAQSGEVTVTVETNVAETLVVTYLYTVPGKIKIYVEGGETGNELTEDTIVYAIESTRAAGIQAVGYDTDDSSAYGSPSAPFSWFYRPNNAAIDIAMTVYFDSSSTLSDSEKEVILIEVQDYITDYINDLTLQDKIYKNKILQLAIGSHNDIVDAQITNWKMNDIDMNILSSYIQGGNMEVLVARNIVLQRAVG